MDGSTSSSVPVESGVPQGSVLGPLLFLLHINDLPQVLDPNTKVRLFVVDCLVYRVIKSAQDQLMLQRDPYRLEEWSVRWGMKFHPKKCNVMRITRSKTPLTRMYTLCQHTLEEVNNVKYLGFTINKQLSWTPHIQAVCNKANATLGFLRRNLKSCPQQLKEQASPLSDLW